MKRIFIMICILLICIALSGCDDGRESERRDSYGAKPSMIIYGKDASSGYFSYAVDERTGVVYIIGGAGNWGYMSPALNVDGTPMLKEQLKEMMQEMECSSCEYEYDRETLADTLKTIEDTLERPSWR